MEAGRRFDLALFGATGFTGGLTARYLAANVPAGARWALVGRNRAKLEAVAAGLATIEPAAEPPELLVADAADPAAMAEVAAA
ncbi:MAG TPA: saccharopine dehydrogenase, partial [Solirubrobacterales bacterium]